MSTYREGPTNHDGRTVIISRIPAYNHAPRGSRSHESENRYRTRLIRRVGRIVERLAAVPLHLFSERSSSGSIEIGAGSSNGSDRMSLYRGFFRPFNKFPPFSLGGPIVSTLQPFQLQGEEEIVPRQRWRQTMGVGLNPAGSSRRSNRCSFQLKYFLQILVPFTNAVKNTIVRILHLARDRLPQSIKRYLKTIMIPL